MKIDIEELETADYDVLENIKAAFYRLWKLKYIVVTMTLVGFCAFFVYLGVVGVHTNYHASASIYSAAYGSYEDSAGGVAVMNTYASLLSSSRVSERASITLQQYGITAKQLRSMVASGNIYLSGANANSKSYGYKLSLVVISTAPDYVDEIANAMAKAFTDEINDLLGFSTLQVLDEAKGYASSPSMNVTLYFILFGAGAFMATCAIIYIKEFLSPYVYTISQCEQKREKVLGMIPYNKE